MLLVCPRCQARGLQRGRVLNSESLECRVCGAQFLAPLSPTEALSDQPYLDGCQCVIWREASRRCELWGVNGQGRLRVFEGEIATVDEPFIRGQGWARAVALRRRGSQS